MHSADNEFFEQYKRLDKLCGEIYSCREGVGSYIDDMESEYVAGLRCVNTWAHDFKMLKHVRWVRNKIAHETSRYQICEDPDIDFVYDFYDRIYDGGDPITLLEKAKKEAEQHQREYRKKQTGVTYAHEYAEPEYKSISKNAKKSGCGGCLVFTALVSAAVLAGLIYLVLFLK